MACRSRASFSPPCRTSCPTKTDDEVAGVVPARGEGTGVQVVLEVGKIAVVVLDVVEGRGALLNRRHGESSACKGSNGSRELHVGSSSGRRRSCGVRVFAC
jgi:hypothetical protein